MKTVDDTERDLVPKRPAPIEIDSIKIEMTSRPAPQDVDAWGLLAKYFRYPAVLLCALSLTTAVLYSGTIFFQFVWDDGPQIVNNPLIRSWHTLSRVFVSDLWYHTASRQVYYRPLFVAWSILNYALVGLRPWGWHLGSILLHVGATLAVFWLCRRLRLEYWTAALAALIFALHPIHIESVAWISAASDSMVTMFFALAFGSFLTARDSSVTRNMGWRLASVFLLICALLTKEMAVSFSALVGIYVWLSSSRGEKPLYARIRESVVAMAPYACATLGYVMLRKLALAHSTLQLDAKHGMGDMLLTLPYVLALYLRQLLLPIGLTGLYYTPYVASQIVSHFVLPVLILSATAGLIYFWAAKTKDWTIAFAGCWLLVGLSPSLYIRVFGNGDFVRDRYIYLGSIGFAILAAKAIRLLPSVRLWSAEAMQGAAVAVVCIAYIGVSLPQQAYWYSDLLVYARGHELYPDNPYASIGLGREYSQRGAHDRAIALVEDAVAKESTDAQLTFALAEVYIVAGRKEQGRKALESALRMTPAYSKSETGGANVAALWAQLGDTDRALTICSSVLSRDPNLYSALYNCGNIQLMAGHYGPAEQLLRRAVESAPQLAAPRHFLGRSLLLQGKNAEGQVYLSQAAALDPTVYDYHYWLGQSLQQSGNTTGARSEYLEALRLNQDSSEAKLRLAALEAK
jgi:tetratricopeptide (TPR) repeat protein